MNETLKYDASPIVSNKNQQKSSTLPRLNYEVLSVGYESVNENGQVELKRISNTPVLNTRKYETLPPINLTLEPLRSQSPVPSLKSLKPDFPQVALAVSTSTLVGVTPAAQKNSIGHRLEQRKILFIKKRRTSDYTLFFAIFGLVLMMTEQELNISQIYDKTSIYSMCVKAVISLSTLILIVFLLIYHAYDIRLYCVENFVDDWRIAMTRKRIIQICLEIIVCLVHPIPGDYSFTWTTYSTGSVGTVSAQVSYDLLLSLPMFLRLYLICRVLLLHSNLFTDASSKSISALNRVQFNTRFVLKTLMAFSPGTVLIVFVISIFLISSWMLRACERYHQEQHRDILNSFWLIAVTFLAIGYGEFVPNNYCGRAICVCTGLMGVSCTALMVAVLARKLELTRDEKHLHNFMMDTRLQTRHKEAAANIIRESWFIYKYNKLATKKDFSKIRHHRRRFLQAIAYYRQVKVAQRKLNDNQNALIDLAKGQTNVNEMVVDVRNVQNEMEGHLKDLETKISDLHEKITHLPLQIQLALAEQNRSLIRILHRQQSRDK